ncbi:type III polyketide synthase [Sphingobium sp. AN558]|uniref:type III polyketide synthase n=1 Tax=Sphingobium sp. AN558 TaxID=3133442 RepID=UPI0030C0B7AE
MSLTPCIKAISTATPPHDVHHAFIDWAGRQLTDERERALFARLVDRARIDHRWSVMPPEAIDQSTGAFYDAKAWPGTAQRMAIYAREAPALAEQAVRGLGSLDGVTHLVVASCTGFVAPGVDQLLAKRLGLAADVERVLIGFMGCYAAIAALRTAYHIIRSQPHANVLVVTVELSSLHLQKSGDLETLLAMLLFADGAAAALVSARPAGLEIDAPFSIALDDSSDLITWTVTDTGFAMGLSGKVPARVAGALADPDIRKRIGADEGMGGWAVHGGGRSILDAVERGFDLPLEALMDSRAILRDFGNMSSATIMFVLARILARDRPQTGVALAFGPGLAIEGFHYRTPR